MLEKEKIFLNKSELINAINISIGIYKPLDRFCNLNDYKSIISKKILNKNKLWTIPILLNLKKNRKIQIGRKYYLYFKTKKIGVIEAASVFKIEKKKFCKALFNTNSKLHPSVNKIYKEHNLYLGGKIKLLKKYHVRDKYFVFNDFNNNNKAFIKSVVFTSRNICHLGHELIHEYLVNKNKKLCICIIENDKNKYDPQFIINSYKKLKVKNTYKNVKISKIFLPSLMAGPREAVLQAICFKNMGFQSIVIGRNHAGYKNYFKKYEAQKIFQNIKKISINIIKVREPKICLFCKKVFFENKVLCKCKKNRKFSTINGSQIKKLLLKSDFSNAKNFLNPLILQYCKKNINILRKF